MEIRPRVSVIIPVYNDPLRLKRCLDALAEQTFPMSEVEVLVVDNGSDDPPVDLIAGYPFSRLLHESSPGSYAARNRGLAEAVGSLLAFTDSDCIPSPDWLATGVLEIDAQQDGGSVGGAIDLFALDPDHPTAAELYDIALGLQQESYVKLYHYAATANLITSRRVMDSVGTFNADLKSSGDADWGSRAHTAGWPLLYSPEALVRHPARRTLAEVLRKARRHAGGRIDYQRVRPDKPSRLHIVRTALRMLMPHWRLIVMGQQRLAERGYGWAARLRFAAVTLLVQYAKAFEMIRTWLGGSSTRG